MAPRRRYGRDLGGFMVSKRPAAGAPAKIDVRSEPTAAAIRTSDPSDGLTPPNQGAITLEDRRPINLAKAARFPPVVASMTAATPLTT
jgi:hypothetical protein